MSTRIVNGKIVGRVSGDLSGSIIRPQVISVANVQSGTLSVKNGGTGTGSFLQNGVLIGHGTSSISSITGSNNGDFLMWADGDWRATPPAGTDGALLLTKVTTDSTLTGSGTSANPLSINPNYSSSIYITPGQIINFDSAVNNAISPGIGVSVQNGQISVSEVPLTSLLTSSFVLNGTQVSLGDNKDFFIGIKSFITGSDRNIVWDENYESASLDLGENLNITNLSASNVFIDGQLVVSGSIRTPIIYNTTIYETYIADKKITLASGALNNDESDNSGIIFGVEQNHIIYSSDPNVIQISPGITSSYISSSFFGSGSGLTDIQAINITGLRSQVLSYLSGSDDITFLNGTASLNKNYFTFNETNYSLGSELNIVNGINGDSFINVSQSEENVGIYNLAFTTNPSFNSVTASYFTGSGLNITNLTASNIDNFGSDVRGQFVYGDGLILSESTLKLTSSHININNVQVNLGDSIEVGLIREVTSSDNNLTITITGATASFDLAESFNITSVTSSFSGSGLQIYNITSSNISNFAQDVRSLFYGGDYVTINTSSGEINISDGFIDTINDSLSGSGVNIIRFGKNITGSNTLEELPGADRFISLISLEDYISDITASGVFIGNGFNLNNIDSGSLVDGAIIGSKINPTTGPVTINISGSDSTVIGNLTSFSSSINGINVDLKGSDIRVGNDKTGLIFIGTPGQPLIKNGLGPQAKIFNGIVIGDNFGITGSTYIRANTANSIHIGDRGSAPIIIGTMDRGSGDRDEANRILIHTSGSRDVSLLSPSGSVNINSFTKLITALNAGDDLSETYDFYPTAKTNIGNISGSDITIATNSSSKTIISSSVVLNNNKNGLLSTDISGNLKATPLNYGIIVANSDGNGNYQVLSGSKNNQIISWDLATNKWVIKDESASIPKPRSQPLPIYQKNITDNGGVESLITTFTLKQSEWTDGFKLEFIGVVRDSSGVTTGSYNLYQYGQNSVASPMFESSKEVTYDGNNFIRSVDTVEYSDMVPSTSDDYCIFEIRGKTFNGTGIFDILYLAVLPVATV